MRSRLRALDTSIQLLSNNIRPRTGVGPPGSRYGRIDRTADRIPDGPSCSRWFSCTCCCSTSNAPPPSSRSTPSARVGSVGRPPRPTITPTPGPQLESPGSSESSIWKEEKSPLLVSRTTLRLPPTLPYSPSSIPFQRHLDILSLSLSSDPLESWSVYSAIHEDLKRHVSDDLYCSLIRHQLEEPDHRTRCQRIIHLLKFAKECGMSFDKIRVENLTAIVSLDLCDPRVGWHDTSSFEEMYEIFSDAWQSLARGRNGDLSGISAQVIQAWIRFLIIPLSGSELVNGHRQAKMAFTAIKQLGQAKGLRPGMEEVLSPIFQWTRKTKPRTLSQMIWTQKLETFTYLSSIGLELMPFMGKDILKHLLLSMPGKLSGEEKVEQVDQLVKRLKTSTPLPTAQLLDRCWAQVKPQALSRSEQARALIGSTTTFIPSRKMARKGIGAMARAAQNKNDTGDLDEAIDLSLSLLEEITITRRTEDIDFVVAILRHLDLLPRTEASLSITHRFIRILLEGDLLSRLRPRQLSILLRHLTLSPTTGKYSYFLSKMVYWQLGAVSTHPEEGRDSLDWGEPSLRAVWSNLIRAAVNKGDIPFISRVYADYHANGWRIGAREALRIIKRIAAMPSDSRLILLERHVKDYLFQDLGPVEELIHALVQGLTSTKDPEDAWLAFSLVNRLRRGPYLSPQDGRLLIDVLLPEDHVDAVDVGGALVDSSENHIADDKVSDDQLSRVARCAVIIRHLEDPSAFLTRLMKALSTPGEASPYVADSRSRLSIAQQIYTGLQRRDRALRPDSTFFSLLIREMAQAGAIDRSLAAYKTYMGVAGVEVSDQVAGTLMIRLGMKRRYADANAVERMWREKFGQGSFESSKALAGARVYLETMQGRQVDVDALNERLDRLTNLDIDVVRSSTAGGDERPECERSGSSDHSPFARWDAQAYVDAARGLTIGVGGPRVAGLKSKSTGPTAEEEVGSAGPLDGHSTPAIVDHGDESADSDDGSSLTDRFRFSSGSRSTGLYLSFN